MALDQQEFQKLLKRRQAYFLPYYLEIVDRHPEGVLAKDVKDEVATLVLSQFGIDIYNIEQCGLNRSTGKSRADQWVNNLVSNWVLDPHMLVVRSHRATLYPGRYDNSRPLLPTGPPLEDSEVAELNNRDPRTAPVSISSSTTFQRSLQLADHVRALNDYQCAVGGLGCVTFTARDGKPYVEIHHIIPMAKQSQSEINLDRVNNMAPLCPRCHACLHRGGAEDAETVLGEVLAWFQSQHGQSHADANNDLILGTTTADLLSMYGL
jgi:5-methylcytosine-specific restriction endonuclease McrA